MRTEEDNILKEVELYRKLAVQSSEEAINKAFEHDLVIAVSNGDFIDYIDKNGNVVDRKEKSPQPPFLSSPFKVIRVGNKIIFELKETK